MTFQQYIDNPMGKKAAVFSQREMYKDLYTKKYGAVLLRENGSFTTKLYYDKGKDRYFIHMRVPSEVVPKFYYDVVVEFYPISAANNTDTTLNNYGVKFFSNDPAFVFTYEYVFSNNGLFIDELKPCASKTALKEKPKERNPYEIPGYVKSLYFCFLHMKGKSLFNKTHWKNYAEKFVIRTLINNIEPADKKILDRQRKGEEIEVQKKAEKAKARREASSQRTSARIQPSANNAHVVNIVKPKPKISGKSSIGSGKSSNAKVIKKK